MPTQQTTYNSRVTDEALEKKFRDTFKSQGGAELVDDLYAQGVIVPIVDFTSAAQGSELRSDLQSAFDFATGYERIENQTTTIINTPGFWKLQINLLLAPSTTSSPGTTKVFITDPAFTSKIIWSFFQDSFGANELDALTDQIIVFLRSGDLLRVESPNNFSIVNVSYRQIADVYGNLTNPLGFTSS